MKRLLIGAIALTLSGCEMMQSIDQSLYSTTESMTQRDMITGKRVVSSSRESQIKKGNAIVEDALAKMDEQGIKYNEALDPEAYERLVNIFDRLHAVSHLKDEQWKVIYIPDDSFNAFVTGGTYVVVHRGLVTQLSEDNEIAAVLGHELGHVAANHIGERQSHLMFGAVLGSGSAKRSSFQSAFTHESEEEADKVGILYASLAGYDPYAAHKVWQRKYDSSGDYGNIFTDHPVYSERAAQTKDTAIKTVQYYTPNQTNADHQAILKDNSLFKYRESVKQEGGNGAGLAALLSTSLESMAKHQQAKNEEKRQANRIAVLNSVNSLLKVTAIDQLSQDQWRFTVKYNGNKNIAELSFVGSLFQGQQKLANFKAKPKGYFAPGGKYYVVAAASNATPLNTKVTSYIFKATEVKVY